MLSEKISRLARSSGIDVIAFTSADEFSNYALPDSPRKKPKTSLSGAKSIIIAGIYIGGFSLPFWDDPAYGRTSRLYLSEFFLDVVKPLYPVADLLRKEGYQALICESSTRESSIVPLKLAGIRAGLGWQGKNSLLITRKFGSFLALGGILTNAELPHNTPEKQNFCKNCNICQQACPTGALSSDYVLCKEKCISYQLQIENITEDSQGSMENRIGDCEICQQVCPWNIKHIEKPLDTKRTMIFREEIPDWESFFRLSNLINLTENEYFEYLGKLNTSIPYKIFHRNVNFAMKYLNT